MKEKAFSIFYFSGLIITTIIMLLQLFRIISFDIIFLFFFWAINFLSGFGIILSLANLYLLFLDKLRNKLDKKAVKIFLFIEILIPVFLAIFSPNKDEYWISSKVEYEINDRIKLTLGADIFGGEADGFFGQFDSKDRIYFELKYSF